MPTAQNVLTRETRTRSRMRFLRLSGHIRAILDTIREPFVVLDGKLRIRLVNTSFCRMFYLTSKAINGRRVEALGEGAWGMPALRKWLEAFIAKRSDIPDFELEGLFPTIGLRTMVLNARRVELPGSTRHVLLLSIQDITQRKKEDSAIGKLNNTLRIDSMTDELTGLYNRRGYSLLSQHYLDLAHRRGKKIFVIYADVDGLKQINDQSGHQQGDQALMRTADILRKTFRKSDIIARIGGDEFAIATMENGHDNAINQMARLQLNLKHHADQNKYGRPISLSVGVVGSNPNGSSSMEELTRQADAMMYIKKREKHAQDLPPVELS